MVKEMGDNILTNIPGVGSLGMIMAPSMGTGEMIVALNLATGLEHKTREWNIKAPIGVPLSIGISTRSNLMASSIKIVGSSSIMGKAKEGMCSLV
jgi:hypothetical protein